MFTCTQSKKGIEGMQKCRSVVQEPLKGFVLTNERGNGLKSQKQHAQLAMPKKDSKDALKAYKNEFFFQPKKLQSRKKNMLSKKKVENHLKANKKKKKRHKKKEKKHKPTCS